MIGSDVLDMGEIVMYRMVDRFTFFQAMKTDMDIGKT